MCGVKVVGFKKKKKAFQDEEQKHVHTMLTVPPHVFPGAFAGVVCNEVGAKAPVLAWFSFTFINI